MFRRPLGVTPDFCLAFNSEGDDVWGIYLCRGEQVFGRPVFLPKAERRQPDYSMKIEYLTR